MHSLIRQVAVIPLSYLFGIAFLIDATLYFASNADALMNDSIVFVLRIVHNASVFFRDRIKITHARARDHRHVAWTTPRDDRNEFPRTFLCAEEGNSTDEKEKKKRGWRRRNITPMYRRCTVCARACVYVYV